jgi:hypothetical protein
MKQRQTSIEWLVEQLKSKYDIDISRLSVTDKSKAMHKEQIMNAWLAAVERGSRYNNPENEEEYYNQKYGTK